MRSTRQTFSHPGARKLLSAAALALAVTLTAAYADQAMRAREAIWANGEIYDTIGTDTAFTHPPEGSTDGLYNFMDSGLAGQRPVSASAPGDRDYNGGRWTVKLVVFTDQGIAAHDPDGDGVVNFELTSEEAVLAHVELGHLVVVDTPIYFECPLLRPLSR